MSRCTSVPAQLNPSAGGPALGGRVDLDAALPLGFLFLLVRYRMLSVKGNHSVRVTLSEFAELCLFHAMTLWSP